MEALSSGQRYARRVAYDLAFDLVDQARDVICNEAIFTDDEVVANNDLIAEVRQTLERRMKQYASDEVGDAEG